MCNFDCFVGAEPAASPDQDAKKGKKKKGGKEDEEDLDALLAEFGVNTEAVAGESSLCGHPICTDVFQTQCMALVDLLLETYSMLACTFLQWSTKKLG